MISVRRFMFRFIDLLYYRSRLTLFPRIPRNKSTWLFVTGNPYINQTESGFTEYHHVVTTDPLTNDDVNKCSYNADVPVNVT